MCNCYHKTLLVLCTHNVFVSSVFSEQQVAEFYSSVSPKQTQQKKCQKIHKHSHNAKSLHPVGHQEFRQLVAYLSHIFSLPVSTCYGLVTELLRGSYGETGVMEFGKICDREAVNLLRSCYGEVVNLLRNCYGETGVMDFGLNPARRQTNQPSPRHNLAEGMEG